MDSARWAKVRELFEGALDRAPGERAQWLTRACTGDPALLNDVEELLRADAAEPDTESLARPPELIEAYVASARTAEIEAGVGRRFGPYRVLGELGRGGMGAVYLAERADGQYQAQVAIKLIRAGWRGEELQRRFASERQILASLDHPNIARLLDAGVSDDGEPYLVLEYVRGTQLARYCDEARLGLPERIGLFLSICAAVGHAHERLIVHRDLKPSNILVGADGQVKLLDFGVAKLLDAQGGHVETATAARAFTPEYAAPEQIRGEPTTTAVDVYALGLLLCELLSGARPYQPDSDAPAAIERAVLEQEPLRPSTALTRRPGEHAEAIAAARGLGIGSLRSRLRGDLDAIVLKALRKRAADRYASVHAFADDLERHLAHRPVLARQGDTRYRVGRFAQRHALALALGSVAVLALIGGLAAALWQAAEAREQRDIARAEARKTRQALDFVSGVFSIADPGVAQGEKVTARELLERGAERIETELAAHPAERAEIGGMLGRSYAGLGLYPDAVKLQEAAVAAARLTGDTAMIGNALADLGDALVRTTRSKDAIAPLQEAERLLLSLPDGRARAGHAARLLGSAMNGTSRVPEADATFARAYEHLRAAGAERSSDAIESLSDRSATKVLQNDLPAADRLSGEALALAQAHLPEADRVHLNAIKGRAMVLMNLDRDAEAEPLRRTMLERCQRIYGESHPCTIGALNDLGAVLRNLQRLDEAYPLFLRVVELRRAQNIENNLSLATSLNNLAGCELDLGRPEVAERLHREALAIRRSKYGESHYAVGTSLYGVGLALLRQGQVETAEDLFKQSIAITLKAAPDNPLLRVGPTLDLALSQLSHPEHDLDCTTARELVRLREQMRKTDTPEQDRRLMFARSVLGACLVLTRHEAEGRALLDASLERARNSAGADHKRLALIDKAMAQ